MKQSFIILAHSRFLIALPKIKRKHLSTYFVFEIEQLRFIGLDRGNKGMEKQSLYFGTDKPEGLYYSLKSPKSVPLSSRGPKVGRYAVKVGHYPVKVGHYPVDLTWSPDLRV